MMVVSLEGKKRMVADQSIKLIQTNVAGSTKDRKLRWVHEIEADGDHVGYLVPGKGHAVWLVQDLDHHKLVLPSNLKRDLEVWGFLENGTSFKGATANIYKAYTAGLFPTYEDMDRRRLAAHKYLYDKWTDAMDEARVEIVQNSAMDLYEAVMRNDGSHVEVAETIAANIRKSEADMEAEKPGPRRVFVPPRRYKDGQ